VRGVDAHLHRAARMAGRWSMMRNVSLLGHAPDRRPLGFFMEVALVTERGWPERTGAGMDTDRAGPPVASGWRFMTPPGWPEPPAGWRPAPGWAPDPQWPPAPPGWQFWEPDTEHPGPYGAPAQAQPVHPSAAHGAGQPQPIGNWAARPRQNRGWGRRCWCSERWYCWVTSSVP
jgi:hypothetical protein